jgi:hypothetical protein
MRRPINDGEIKVGDDRELTSNTGVPQRAAVMGRRGAVQDK